jgi:hypothetical protein
MATCLRPSRRVLKPLSKPRVRAVSWVDQQADSSVRTDGWTMTSKQLPPFDSAISRRCIPAFLADVGVDSRHRDRLVDKIRIPEGDVAVAFDLRGRISVLGMGQVSVVSAVLSSGRSFASAPSKPSSTLSPRPKLSPASGERTIAVEPSPSLTSYFEPEPR